MSNNCVITQPITVRTDDLLILAIDELTDSRYYEVWDECRWWAKYKLKRVMQLQGLRGERSQIREQLWISAGLAHSRGAQRSWAWLEQSEKLSADWLEGEGSSIHLSSVCSYHLNFSHPFTLSSFLLITHPPPHEVTLPRTKLKSPSTDISTAKARSVCLLRFLGRRILLLRNLTAWCAKDFLESLCCCNADD